MSSWLSIPADSHFSLSNIPFGIITSRNSREKHRPAIAIGDHVLDLQAFSQGSGFEPLPSIHAHLDVFSQSTLNDFAALGRSIHREVRQYLQDVFRENTAHGSVLRDNEALRKEALLVKEDTKLHLPMRIGDYTDFFAGSNHAANAGRLFRGAEFPLSPNYVHLPVGYHSRASSVVISSTPVTRPCGQILLDPKAEPKQPIFSASRKLDIELELGCFLCTGNSLGSRIPIASASDNIFGLVLLNDWSARDIQLWEAQPLGPFNAKNFCTSISGWVVLADALEPFRTTKLSPPTPTTTLPYLTESSDKTVYDIALQTSLSTPDGSTSTISSVSSKNLLFSFEQMIAHHSVGGCNMRTGDLLGSGTISGTTQDSLGCLLEMTRNGAQGIMLAGMDVRTFLKDGDEVVITGVCGTEPGKLVGFGECRGIVQSAIPL